MSENRRLLAALAALALVAATAPRTSAEPAAGAEARPAAAAGHEEAADQAPEWAGFLEAVEASVKRIRDAQARIRELGAMKGNSSRRRYPRGEAKARYLEELTAARKELEEAEAEHPEIVEQARRAGVPAGILADYEEIPDAAPPASEADDDF